MPAIQAPARISIGNILLTTDFSVASQAAVPYAAALARLYGAKLFVAHTVGPEPNLGVPLDRLPHEADKDWREAEHDLRKFMDGKLLTGLAHEQFLERGELWEVTSSIIAECHIDLLVMGTHGRQGLRKLVLGSAAEKIFRQAPCPVLTVGPKATGKPHKPRHILFPTDLSPASLCAMPYALSLAEENEATVTFLNLVPLIPWQEQAAVEENTRKRLEALVPDEAKVWCRPKFEVHFEFPVEGVLLFAEEHNVDIIVMGVHKPAGASLTSHLPWTVASEIVSDAPCPVLTVRA